MFDDGRGVTPAIDRLPNRVVSSLNSWPGGPDRLRRWMLPLYPRAVAELSRLLAWEHARNPIDLLISTSSAAIKGLKPPPGVRHICYCHTPARYLWSQIDEYALGRGGALRSIGLRVFGERLRKWDLLTAENVTAFVANSTHTCSEIRRCYQRGSIVVHPPVLTESFRPSERTRQREGWLFVGALEPYKRADLAIAAAKIAGENLVIVGEGSQSRHLRSIADGHVTFLGRISDAELRQQYQRAAVLVFPQIEDFGIVAVEAQACGLPVVAFFKGGAMDSVVENRTGTFFGVPTPEALAAAVDRCMALGNVSEACRANAERFGAARFEREMLAIIERTLAR